MKQFCCFCCRKYKNIELIGFVKPNKQKVCTVCQSSIKKAEDKIKRRNKDEASTVNN